jgi:hypothetical protein
MSSVIGGLGEKEEDESRQEKPWKRGNTGMYIDIC